MADNKDWVYSFLYEESNDLVDKLLRLYEKNPFYARVVFMSNSHKNYVHNKLCIFDDPDSNDFDIVLFKITNGISTTNKRYRHSKRLITLRYREKTGFWLSRGRSIMRPPNFSVDFPYNCSKIIEGILQKKFSWYRCMCENKISFDNYLTVHKVWNNKLFNLPKLLKAYYNAPISAARLLHNETLKNEQLKFELLILLRSHGKFIKNLENLSIDFLGENLIMFSDSIRMAKKLGKVVNCSWGIKRLKQEHDDWSEEITNILFVEDNCTLQIKGVFYEFAQFTKYYLIKTTRGLALEGQRQKHCVGGYKDSVNSGKCAIFHIDGYTLELRCEQISGGGIGETKFKLINNQFRGFTNKKAPDELVNVVDSKIKEFNERFKEHDCLTKSWFNFNGNESNELVELSLGANEYEIFDLDILDENGEPTQILVDETKVYYDGVDIKDFWSEEVIDGDLPF